MSRLRRPYLTDRYFFVTTNLRRDRAKLGDNEFERLAASMARMRDRRGFQLTAWVFLPDHWHAIICPHSRDTISQIVAAIKVSSMIAINHARGEPSELWQGRFFDHALRTVKDYQDTVLYIHLNPVRRGLVKTPREWNWSSYAEYAGTSATEQATRCGLSIDRVRLPAEEHARI